MNILDLFSGIGGFSLGLERAGMKTVAFCEADKKAQLVLKKHWPEVLIYDDIRTLEPSSFWLDGIPEIDLICGGFPCQPWSVAGKRRGHTDDRDLWPEMLRVIREVKPRWVIGENVQGFIHHEMGLGRTVSDLEKEGYETRVFNIPACAVQAPHERKRVWIVAHNESGIDGEYNPKQIERQKQKFRESVSAEDVAHAECANSRGGSTIKYPNYKGGRVSKTGGESIQSEHREACPNNIEPISSHVAHADAEGPQGRDSKKLSKCSNKRIIGKAGPRHAEPESWESQSRMGRMVDGLSRRLDGHWDVEPIHIPRVASVVKNRSARLKQLGNAVVPQVVEMLGRAIIKTEIK